MQYVKNSFIGILAWLTASLFYAYNCLIISFLTSSADTLMDTMSLSTSQYGLISQIYTFSYALMQIPVGILLDRVSLRKLITISLLVFTISTFFLGLIESYILMLLIRLIMGFAAAFAVLGSLKIAADWFDSNYFATLAGLTVSIGYFGSIIGNHTTHFIELGHSLSSVFFMMSAIGLVLTIMSYCFVANFDHVKPHPLNIPSIVQDIKEICSDRLSLALILYAMLIFTPLLVFKDSLGNTFFKQYYGFSSAEVRNLMDVILYASILAAPILGAISDRMAKRKPIMIITPFMLMLVFALIFMRSDLLLGLAPYMFSVYVFIVFGFFSWGFLLSYSVFKETHSPAIVSTGLGFMNSINMVGSIICVPIITSLIDTLPSYYPSMSAADVYFYAFLALPAFVVLSLPLLKIIPETNCKSIHD